MTSRKHQFKVHTVGTLEEGRIPWAREVLRNHIDSKLREKSASEFDVNIHDVIKSSESEEQDFFIDSIEFDNKMKTNEDLRKNKIDNEIETKKKGTNGCLNLQSKDDFMISSLEIDSQLLSSNSPIVIKTPDFIAQQGSLYDRNKQDEEKEIFKHDTDNKIKNNCDEEISEVMKKKLGLQTEQLKEKKIKLSVNAEKNCTDEKLFYSNELKSIDLTPRGEQIDEETHDQLILNDANCSCIFWKIF